MFSDLKPYPEYKTCRLPWLGKSPARWELKRGKTIFQCIDERSRTGNEELLTVSSERGVVPRKSASVTMFKAASYAGYKLCWPGDLVINSLWAWGRGLGVSPYHGIISSAYGVYRIRKNAPVIPEFIHEFVRSSSFNWELQVRSKGIWISRLQMTDEAFLDAPFLLPSREEQDAIVRFLGYASRRIERAIRSKRKIITLLNEQKQTITHRAVTRGLDSRVPLKHSNIPWLGDIPKHWKVRRLKHCVTPMEQGWSPQCEAQPAGENEWGVLKVGCVNKDSFAAAQNKRLPESLEPEPNLEIHDGDILVSRANTRELLGLAALAEKPRPKLILCDKLFRFRARQECFNPKFLVFALRAKPSRMQIESSTNGASSSMQNIGQGVIKNLWISMPTVVEQECILAQLSTETQPLATAISRFEREIELLREYRTRLVADVVTGQVDVRGVRIVDMAKMEAEEAHSIAEIEAAEAEPAEEAIA